MKSRFELLRTIGTPVSCARAHREGKLTLDKLREFAEVWNREIRDDAQHVQVLDGELRWLDDGSLVLPLWSRNGAFVQETARMIAEAGPIPTARNAERWTR